jgi:hypothetical protein
MNSSLKQGRHHTAGGWHADAPTSRVAPMTSETLRFAGKHGHPTDHELSLPVVCAACTQGLHLPTRRLHQPTVTLPHRPPPVTDGQDDVGVGLQTRRHPGYTLVLKICTWCLQ